MLWTIFWFLGTFWMYPNPPAANETMYVKEEAMVFSAVQNTLSPIQTIEIFVTKGKAKIAETRIEGPHADDFILKGELPNKIKRKKPGSIGVQFSPIGVTGLREAYLSVYLDDVPEPFQVPIYGLSAKGVEGEREPALSLVLETLGYDVNIGWETLANTTNTATQGDELEASLFEKAGPGEVQLLPVARYSPDFELPFGFYMNEGDRPKLNQIGVLQSTSNITTPQHQRLMPELKQGTISFDPDSTAFGIYTASPSHIAYSEDRWNLQFHPDHAAHVTRIYPLKNRAGEVVPNSYLVCFEEAQNGDYQDYVFVLSNVRPVGKMASIFNGQTLHGWYTFLPDYGKNFDPTRIFGVERDGILRISGEKFGYVATDEVYENFHLRLQFKWGQKKWPPRENAKRDSGILYYFPEGATDKVWPKSVECQIQEGDCGDFWLIDNTTISVNGQRNTPGETVQIVKQKDAENPTGEWNTVEVIANKGVCTHIVNGVVVNRGEDPSVRKGRIVLQSEGAEIFYKNIEIQTFE